MSVVSEGALFERGFCPEGKSYRRDESGPLAEGAAAGARGVLPPPNLITLSEWKDWNGPRDYIDSELFRRYQAQHDAALAKIEMYRLAFW